MKIFLSLTAGLFLGLLFAFSVFYWWTSDGSIRIINQSKGHEKIIYEGSQRLVNITYESLNDFNDIVRIMMFGKEKKIISRRLYKSENIEIQYF